MRRTPARLLAAVALVVLMLSGGAAFADTQPTQVSNSEGRAEPDPLPAGPHCHVVLPAGGRAFDQIVTATRHQAHVQTGPGRIFDATDCP